MDIAFTKARIAVFIDGCFWHGCPEHGTLPRANADWWSAKLDRNKARDAETDDVLKSVGWQVIRIWEHETPDSAADRICAAIRVHSLGPVRPEH
jgi:DNA mismatch endonuclease (patch repair protein)